MTVVLTLFLIVGVVGLTAGNDLIEWAARRFGLGGVTELVLQGVRIVLSLIGIILAFSLLYWQGPNVDQQFRWVTPGSILSTIALALLSFGFGIYVDLVGAASYAKTYGTAFGLILFLYFLYLASQVIVLGAEFNAETTKRYDPETIRDKITDPRKQLPGEQPAPHPQAAREAGVSQGQVLATNRTSAQKVAAGERRARGGHQGRRRRQWQRHGHGRCAASGAGARHERPGRSRQRQRRHPQRRRRRPERHGSAAQPRDRRRGSQQRPSRTVTASESPATRPGAEEAPRRGPDRTGLVALAVAGAAVAGALAMGFLRRDRER